MTMFLALLASSTPADARHVYSCDQINVVDPNEVQHVDFVTNAHHRAAGAQVVNVASGRVLVGPAKLTSMPGYANGYWYDNYRLLSYEIGWAQDDRYMFLVPAGPIGATVDIDVHILFGGGQYGWWQNFFSCAVTR